MVPLDRRDALYRLFIASLDDPAAASGFDRLLLTSHPSQAYLRDRIPRYRAVLAAWSGRPQPSDPAARALALSELLFNQGLFFDCHEYLETAWKAARGPWKTCFQGLIQIAAGFHKLELSPGSTGAAELIEKGMEKLMRSPQTLRPEFKAEIGARLEKIPPAIRSGNFDVAAAPRLRWNG